jgi:methionine--tRNA ligase beta chain
MISFEDFKKLDLRVGKIINVEEILASKKLLKLTVDFGTEKRQAIAGIKQYYKPEELIDKKFVFVLNLEPRKIFGEESNCMILAAEDENGNVILLQPEKDIKEGSKVH